MRVVGLLAGLAGALAGLAAFHPTTLAARTTHARAHTAPNPVSNNPNQGLDVLPFPGTPDAAPATNIIFPATPKNQITSITATGTHSGTHQGHLSTQPAGQGSAFTPQHPFTPGEHVIVTATLRTTKTATATGSPHTTHIHWTFTIAQTAAVPAAPRSTTAGREKRATVISSRLTHSYLTAPHLHPPIVKMSGHDTDRGQGDIFLDAENSGQPAAYFLNPMGDVRWYKPSTKKGGGPSIFNVRVQAYHARPVITYWRGVVQSPPGCGHGEGLILNEHYQTIHTVTAGDGYRKQGTDLHEFTLGRHGHEGVAFVTVWSPVKANLTSIGGPANGKVIDWIIQEIDIKTNKVIWEWHSLHHVPITDSYEKYSPGQLYDYFHLNSIQQLSNGHLIISARNTWSVYSIDEKTGKVAWELGGKHSSFSLGSGARFYWQHHATLHNHGILTVFDDGAPPPEEPESRALVLHISTSKHTATLVRAYTHDPPTLAYSQGAVQILPDHHVFVGWGSRPYFSEYTADGDFVFGGAFRVPVQSYRAYRFSDWKGYPLQAPAVAVRKTSSANRYSVYVSWNGSTTVARWRVVGSDSRNGHFRRLTGRDWVAFETRIPVSTHFKWLKVQALGPHGHQLANGASAAVKT